MSVLNHVPNAHLGSLSFVYMMAMGEIDLEWRGIRKHPMVRNLKCI